MFEELPLEDQVETIKSIAPKMHAVGSTHRRAYIPSLHLLEGLNVSIASKRLRIDATTAIALGHRGYSKFLMHLEKTLGVSVAFVAEAARKLGIDLAQT